MGGFLLAEMGLGGGSEEEKCSWRGLWRGFDGFLFWGDRSFVVLRMIRMPVPFGHFTGKVRKTSQIFAGYPQKRAFLRKTSLQMGRLPHFYCFIRRGRPQIGAVLWMGVARGRSYLRG